MWWMRPRDFGSGTRTVMVACSPTPRLPSQRAVNRGTQSGRHIPATAVLKRDHAAAHGRPRQPRALGITDDDEVTILGYLDAGVT